MSLSLAGSGQISGFDAGLSGFGGLVAVKSALKTDTFSASVATQASVDVTGLSITHEVADPSNKLIISAFFGAASTTNQTGAVGISIYDGTNLLAIGDASGSRTQVTAGGNVLGGSTSNLVVTMPSINFVHTPGSGSKTYTVRAINIDTSTRTLYVNRAEDATDTAFRPLAASSLVIMEVSV